MSKTIQATVLQKNSAAQYFCGPCGDYGKVMPIPCGTGTLPGVDMWAEPIKAPYPQGWQFVIGDQPTIDSLACFRLTNSITGDTYVVLGTVAAYSAGCNACCDASPVPSLVVTSLIDIPSCQDTCTLGVATEYDAIFAVPAAATLAGKYVSRVEVDGVLVNQQLYAAGSVSIAALVTYLNTNASSAGTWSNPDEQSIRLRTTSVKTICFIACDKTA